METHAQTPFEKIEEYLYCNQKKDKLYSAVQLILAFGKDKNGDFTAEFLAQIEKGFKEHINYLMDKAVNADLELIRRELKKRHYLKKRKEADLHKALTKDIAYFYSLLGESETELDGDALWATLFVWMDGEYTCPIFASQSLKIFTEFCLSVLKGEYLYNDNLSTTKIDPLRYHIRSSFINLGSRIVLLFFARSDPDYYLKDIENLCDLYFKFNRKIDNVIDYKSNATLHLMKVEEAADEMSKYQTGMNMLSHEPEGLAILLNLSLIYPYLFLYILEMTYIDHNFIVGGKELNTLLTLKTVIKQVCDFFNDELEQALGLIDEKVKTKFLRMLQLVEFKNDFLIYKTIISDKSGLLDNYTFIGGHHIIKFAKDQFSLKKEDGNLADKDILDIDILLEKYCESTTNDLIKEVNVYNQLIKGKVFLDNEPSLKNYEKHFCKVICDKEEHKIQKHFDQISLSYKAKKGDVPITEFADITSYNRKIAQHAKEQFVKYGKYIKRLDSLADASLQVRIEYLQDLNRFLQNVSNIYSCSFIIKHTNFVLNELKILCDKSSYDIFGFTLRMEVEALLHVFEKLLKSIDNGTYCMNFASLYQDCFYNFQWQDCSRHLFSAISRKEYHDKRTIERGNEVIEQVDGSDVMANLKEDVFASGSDSETIFIASTWMRPVGKEELKNKFEQFRFEKNNNVARFYSLYFSYHENKNKQQEKKFDKLMKDFNVKADETKKNMVQTLGIFAAFLALATISISALKNSSSPVDYLKVIFSVTFCLGMFVLMLDHVFSADQSVVISEGADRTDLKGWKLWRWFFRTKTVVLYLSLFILLCLMFLL